jgi:hypothetical protein
MARQVSDARPLSMAMVEIAGMLVISASPVPPGLSSPG